MQTCPRLLRQELVSVPPGGFAQRWRALLEARRAGRVGRATRSRSDSEGGRWVQQRELRSLSVVLCVRRHSSSPCFLLAQASAWPLRRPTRGSGGISAKRIRLRRSCRSTAWGDSGLRAGEKQGWPLAGPGTLSARPSPLPGGLGAALGAEVGRPWACLGRGSVWVLVLALLPTAAVWSGHAQCY